MDLCIHRDFVYSVLIQKSLSGNVDRAFVHGVDPCKTLATTVSNTGIRVVCHSADYAGFLSQKPVHTVKLAATASEGDTVGGNVADQLR